MLVFQLEMNLREAQEHHEVGLLPVAGAAALAIAGVAIYRKLNQETDPALLEASLLPYCIDIAATIMDTHEALIVGGLPIDAFNAKDSIIDVENATILVSDRFDTKLIRKENGSVRDYDIIIPSKDRDGRFKRLSDQKQHELKARLTAAAAGRAMRNHQPRPEMSVFSFDEHSSLFHSATVVNEDGGLELQQGFVTEPLPEESMQPWDLVLADPDRTTVQILNPWEQYWRSMVRFSSGIKVKDVEKLTIMREKLENIPELAAQAEGPLCQVYSRFSDRMLDGNSMRAFGREVLSDDRDWQRVNRLGWLATARFAMAAGQKSKNVTKIVQSVPKVFNLFVGSK